MGGTGTYFGFKDRVSLASQEPQVLDEILSRVTIGQHAYTAVYYWLRYDIVGVGDYVRRCRSGLTPLLPTVTSDSTHELSGRNHCIEMSALASFTATFTLYSNSHPR